MLPIVGDIVILVFSCFDSQKGENEYGPNPKQKELILLHETIHVIENEDYGKGVKVLEIAEYKKYLLYFLSYVLVYLTWYPILFFLLFTTDDPSTPQWYVDNLGNFVTIGQTIFGAIALNILFKKIIGLKKNNKYSWLIFLLHLVLIPFSHVIIRYILPSTV